MGKKKRQREIEEAVSKAYVKGYSDAGASITKRALKGFSAKSGSSQEDIDFNNKTLRQRSRMLYMASPIAAGAINTNRTKVVGVGLKLKSSINRDVLGLSAEQAQEWQRTVEAEWRLWSEKKTCDALELNNFVELQQLALKSWLMSGDVFALIKRYEASPLNPYTLRIHLIEADRVSTPVDYKSIMTTGSLTEGENKENGNPIHDGVETDKSGKVVAYHICNHYPDAVTLKDTEWTRVERTGRLTGLPNILHLMSAERPEQYRGVSYLAPVIEPLLQMRRYTESELIAALIQSYFTAWITTNTDPSMFPLDSIYDEDGESNGSEVNYEMGPGEVIHLEPGENVTLGNPNIPTAGFEVFTKNIIKQIGAGLELPYDVLIKEFNASYSAAKGALEEAWELFKMVRSWFVDDFCKPIYELWLTEAVANGRIKAPGFFSDPRIRAAWCRSRWDGPAQTHLDPVKEARAAEIEVAHGWKTNEQVTREFYGGDWQGNASELLDEVQIASQFTVSEE